MVLRLAVVLAGCALASAAGAAAVSPAARWRARADGEVAVIVMLRAPEAAGGRTRAARRAAIARRQAAVLGALAPGDVVVDHAYAALPGFAARITAAGLERLAADPDVLRVDVDVAGGAAVAPASNVAQVRADRVQARGVDGTGVTIGVIDAGVDAGHPDISGALTGEECFCRAGRIGGRNRAACCPDGTAHQSGAGSAAAVQSHGPHVAGIALSRGHVGPRGVAPGARLVAVRVLDAANQGFLSDWIAALDWILSERPEVRVVNMSLASGTLYAGDCGSDCGGQSGCAAVLLMGEAVRQLRQGGTLLFAAAGNNGDALALSAPACIAQAVAVGAVDGTDAVAKFSNSGAQLDLLAPGVDILSSAVGGGVTRMSGTSMAAPHAAAAAALLISARPGLGADAVEGFLRDTGAPVMDTRTGGTTPRADAFAGLRSAIRGGELERGSGSRVSDCLLEWSIIPPDVVARRGWPTVTCRDGDPLCDSDSVPGRCTFTLSPCFNMHDPLLRRCRVDEPLLDLVLTSPRPAAPPGSVEQTNAAVLEEVLPSFPFAGSDACTPAIPLVVERLQGGGIGIAHLRVAVATATRRDYDHLVFQCLPSQ